ncbi:VTC domain-containing protein [Mortierella sp. GBAus27b]|nr:vacuolar transporter chaperone [Mortierella sp. GBA43]KAI8346451.1 VTC domain-containing protein [Mortierella sp. GBAus27b]
MKFGTQLQSQRASQWKYHYVDYDGLKELLKTKSHEREFTAQDEYEFVKHLNAELEKVASFQTLKLGEIQRRTEHCEQIIQQHQLPSGKSTERLTLSSFVETESEINKVTQDLQDLARFQRLNYTAFLKIVKKHDKHTGFTLRAHFMNQHLNNHPFHKENFSLLVRRLSCLFNVVRTGTVPTVTRAQSIDSEEEELERHPGCIPKKTAFWVHPDCTMDLKMLILKYLPLVVYEPTPALNSSHKSGSSQLSTYLASESPVSTVYLDNQDFDLYMDQLENRERSETVRLRWYGSEQKQLWVEHQQRSIQSSSVGMSSSSTVHDDEVVVSRHRFQIKSKYVPKLVQGCAPVKKVVEQLRLSGQKTEREIQEFEEATRIMQSRIKKRGLQPVVQTFFNRTAFQVPGDARVRITIDTDVVMVRERKIETSELYDRPWYPTDLSAEKYPFPEIREQDIIKFPYAIMQIRTLTEPQEDIPSWVDRIAQSHLVEMVPNFAKDLHGIATLYDSRVGLLPFWLSDMDRDIRKPAMLTGGFPHHSIMQDSNSNSGSNDSLNSGQSTAATTISDASIPSSSQVPPSSLKKKPSRSRKSILDPNETYTPNVTFDEQVQDLVAASRMMLERHPSNGNLNGGSSSESSPKAKKPVVSCLKKTGSFSSMRSQNSSNEDLHSPRGGYGSSASSVNGYYGSTGSRRRKRVTFERSAAQKWFDKVMDWLPSLGMGSSSGDIEAQYGYSSRRRGSAYRILSKLFWTGLSLANVMLLFIGLLLALMNLGDSVGLEAASLFLVVSCLCMGTSVWAHLIRMDGHESSLSEPSDEDDDHSILASKKYFSNERSGLLSGNHDGKTHSSQFTYGAHRGRWVRTRLLPVLTFVCLGAVVGLNAAVRMRPFGEDVEADD